MRRRKARKTKSLKRRSSKRSTRSKSGPKKSATANQKAHWAAYKHLQKRCDEAWAKLRANVKRKASPQVLMRDKNNLLLLLGECNYMVRECTRMASRKKRK